MEVMNGQIRGETQVEIQVKVFDSVFESKKLLNIEFFDRVKSLLWPFLPEIFFLRK